MPTPPQPTSRASDDTRTWTMFVLLSFVWGSSFLFIKIGLDEGVAPLTIVSYRTLFGGLLLGAVLLIRGGRLPLAWDVWKRMTFLALTNIVIPMGLIAWGQQYIATGMAAIFNALVPLFTFVLATVVLRSEAATPVKVAGLAIGFFGVVLLASPSVRAASGDGDALLAVAGMAAVALAALFYAIAVNYTRLQLNGQPIITEADGTRREPMPREIAFGSTLMGFLLVTTLALLLERPAGSLLTMPAGVTGWVALVLLGVLGTGLAYLLLFRLIERWGATRTTLVTYVIPVVAIALGFVLLGERLQPIELAGAALVIGGVVLVNANIDRWRTERTEATGPVEP